MNVLEAVRQNTEYVKKIDELEKKLNLAENLLKNCQGTRDSDVKVMIEKYFTNK